MPPTDSSQLEARLEFAISAARQAGQQTLSLFRTPGLQAQRKGDGSPVTEADREAEHTLRRLTTEQFPEDAILGEEFGESSGTSGFRWIFDPIDGTKAFIAGVPLYTTLVALLEGELPRLGVIYAPATARELVYALDGHGCWHVRADHQPQQARVSAVKDIGEAVCVTSSVKSFTTERETDARAVYDRLQSACRITRTWGDAYGYLLVATGRAEIAIDPAMSLWDTAPLQPIIQEAGGTFCDWQGRPTVHSGESVATNAALAPTVLAMTQASPR